MKVGTADRQFLLGGNFVEQHAIIFGLHSGQTMYFRRPFVEMYLEH